MGYIPPYVPDSYLQTLKYIPVTSYKIKKVEPVYKSELKKHRLQNTMRKHYNIYQHPYGKGFYLDRYV